MGKRSLFMALFLGVMFVLPATGCVVHHRRGHVSQPHRHGHVHTRDNRRRGTVRNHDRGRRVGHQRGRGNPHRRDR